MEAVAHSPSFAKKAGVPQSVGKDFSAADKGRKFSKGGDMTESKKMVGKEVAFMKKKGAPAAMIKHEKSEMMGMKKGGKVRRYGAGGGPLGDESIMTDEEYAKQKEQGAKNLKSLKNFFGFGEKEPAPIDRSRDIDRTTKSNEGAVYTPRPPLGITKNQSPRTSSGASAEEDAVERSDAASMDNTAKGPQFISSIAKDEGKYSGPSFKQELKQEPRVSRPRNPIGVEKTQTKERVITAPVKPSAKDVSKFSSDSPDLESRMEAMKPKRKFGMASDETRAAIRKGLGSAFDFFDLSKAHEREFGKKMAKGGNVDGIAKKGKTEGKVVKMASGGFVKTADGCAQRGKTKAFQVKMNRGGMC
jgi:hypothetical protein